MWPLASLAASLRTDTSPPKIGGFFIGTPRSPSALALRSHPPHLPSALAPHKLFFWSLSLCCWRARSRPRPRPVVLQSPLLVVRPSGSCFALPRPLRPRRAHPVALAFALVQRLNAFWLLVVVSCFIHRTPRSPSALAPRRRTPPSPSALAHQTARYARGFAALTKSHGGSPAPAPPRPTASASGRRLRPRRYRLRNDRRAPVA